jgi:hypothetical protein
MANASCADVSHRFSDLGRAETTSTSRAGASRATSFKSPRSVAFPLSPLARMLVIAVFGSVRIHSRIN